MLRRVVAYLSLEKNELCMGCMEPVDGSLEVCPACGYVKNFQGNIEKALPVGTEYDDRYIFGEAKSSDGEGIIYIGYDKSKEEKVYIKEFAPFLICERSQNQLSIYPKNSCEVKFKALYSDFKELALTLKELSPILSIIPLVDTFEKNGTVYSVYKYLKVVTLEQFLTYNDNFMAWSEAKQLFRPIFGTLTLLQEKKILHRAISPHSIYIDENNNLYLSDFSIASNRTRFSEIPETISKFYGAPEQYEASGWQGNWTDVYGLCATLYRTLTGSVPLDVFELSKGRRSASPNFVNNDVPLNVSNAIIKGMEFNTKARTQSVYDLLSELLDCTEGNTAVYNVADVKSSSVNYKENENNDENDDTNDTEQDKKSSRKLLVFGSLIAIVAIVLVSVGINYYLFTATNTGKDETQNEEQVQIEHVPLFVNKRINTIIGNAIYDEKFLMNYVYEFNSSVPDGVIYKQEPGVGTPVEKGRQVTIYVSKGANQIIVPDLIEKEIPEAMNILNELGIKYNFENLQKGEDEQVDYNKVYSTEPVAGETINVGESVVTLYIYSQPENQQEQENEDENDNMTEEEQTSEE